MNENEFRLALHQKLCETADLILRHYNPCQMNGNACLKGDPNPCCIRTRFKRWDAEDKRCYFFDGRGCSFPNIECKVWLCDVASRNASLECITALKHLMDIAKMNWLTNES